MADDERCFVCERGATPEDGSVVQLCGCRSVHAACLTGFRVVRAGTVDEVACTVCGELHQLLPTHLADGERRGRLHLALVELWLPARRRGVRCAVVSGVRGRAALEALAREGGCWEGLTPVPTVVCQIAGDRYLRFRGWDEWSWGVYCVAVSQARHGVGRHRVEVAVTASRVGADAANNYLG